jgi:hypothetical protein
MSITLHQQLKWLEQTKCDDLEALVYTLIYLASGPLPWHSLSLDNTWKPTDEAHLAALSAARARLSFDDLRGRLPSVFVDFLERARNADPTDYSTTKGSRGLLQRLIGYGCHSCT